MNKEKFPEYRNKVYKYIQEEIVPKYDVIESCTMHILPIQLIANVEFIFNLNYKLSEEDLSLLNKIIKKDLYSFVKTLNINGPYMSRVVIIFL